MFMAGEKVSFVAFRGITMLAKKSPRGHPLSYEDLKAALDESLPYIGGEVMATIADSLIEQGIHTGIHTGILQKAREAVIEILEVRFEIAPASTIKIINDI
jgi:hypothetical protein